MRTASAVKSQQKLLPPSILVPSVTSISLPDTTQAFESLTLAYVILRVPGTLIFQLDAGVAECRYISLFDVPVMMRFWNVEVAEDANSSLVFVVVAAKLFVTVVDAAIVVVAEVFTISRL